MLLAIDPGGSTGMAFRLDDNQWATITLDDPKYDIKGVITKIAERATLIEVVIIESFLGIQYRGSHGIDTLKLLGAVHGVCALFNIPVVEQTPAQRKAQEQNARRHMLLRKEKLGLGYTDHELSAMSHLLTYERRIYRAQQEVEAKTAHNVKSLQEHLQTQSAIGG